MLISKWFICFISFFFFVCLLCEFFLCFCLTFQHCYLWVPSSTKNIVIYLPTEYALSKCSCIRYITIFEALGNIWLMARNKTQASSSLFKATNCSVLFVCYVCFLCGRECGWIYNLHIVDSYSDCFDFWMSLFQYTCVNPFTFQIVLYWSKRSTNKGCAVSNATCWIPSFIDTKAEKWNL